MFKLSWIEQTRERERERKPFSFVFEEGRGPQCGCSAELMLIILLNDKKYSAEMVLASPTVGATPCTGWLLAGQSLSCS